MINRRLNIVIPIEREGGTIWVHSSPVMGEVLESNLAVLARTYAAIVELGVGNSCGPNVAMSFLTKIADQMQAGETISGALIPEIQRLTMVIAPNENGWQPLPYEVALKRGVIDAEDVREAMGALVFFMLVCAMSKRSQVAARLAAPGEMFGFQTTSLNSTEWATSLPTLSKEETSTEKTPGLLLPS